MSSTVPMLEIDGKNFNHDDAVGRMGDIMNEFMDARMPAFIIRQAGEDIDQVSIEALRTCGWSLIRQKPSFDITVTARKSFSTFWFSSRHIEAHGYWRYPEDNTGGIVIRGHNAKKGAADVWMRSASRKEVGSPSHRFMMFGPDKQNPIHITTQNPGDRVMFILYGGEIEGVVIPPAQHDFKRKRVAEKARQIRLTDFVILPTKSPE